MPITCRNARVLSKIKVFLGGPWGLPRKKPSAKGSQWAHTLPAFAPDPLVQLLFPHLEYFGWLSGALFEKSFGGGTKGPISVDLWDAKIHSHA